VENAPAAAFHVTQLCQIQISRRAAPLGNKKLSMSFRIADTFTDSSLVWLAKSAS
jgi:hypothetical protein